MIPFDIHYHTESVTKVEGSLVPTMYVRQLVPARSTTSTENFFVAPTLGEIPQSFAEGMREIQEGRAVDFDSALGEAPPEE